MADHQPLPISEQVHELESIYILERANSEKWMKEARENHAMYCEVDNKVWCMVDRSRKQTRTNRVLLLTCAALVILNIVNLIL